jgi:elongation factor G
LVYAAASALAYVVKTINTSHGGKMSLARVLAGQIGDGTTLNSQDRELGASRACPRSWARASRSAGRPLPARPCAFGKLDHAKTGDTLAAGKEMPKRLVASSLSGGAGDFDCCERAQGRCETRPGA